MNDEKYQARGKIPCPNCGKETVYSVTIKGSVTGTCSRNYDGCGHATLSRDPHYAAEVVNKINQSNAAKAKPLPTKHEDEDDEFAL